MSEHIANRKKQLYGHGSIGGIKRGRRRKQPRWGYKGLSQCTGSDGKHYMYDSSKGVPIICTGSARGQRHSFMRGGDMGAISLQPAPGFPQPPATNPNLQPPDWVPPVTQPNIPPPPGVEPGIAPPVNPYGESEDGDTTHPDYQDPNGNGNGNGKGIFSFIQEMPMWQKAGLAFLVVKAIK